MMLGASGKNSRPAKGEFIKLEELLDKAKEAAAEINPKSAEELGVGAVKYYDLSHHRLSDTFSMWMPCLTSKGIRLLISSYTYSRLNKIAKKAKGLKPKINVELLSSEAENESI
jgi:arginyl-tRNA synthetase